MKKLLLLTAMIMMYSFTFSQITLTASVTPPTCYGYANGSATITPTGGTAPYTYTWSGASTETTSIANSLASGAGTVVVEDALSNTATLTVIVPVPPQLIPTVTSTSALCFGTATGTINIISVSGGVAPYQYELNGGAYSGSSSFTSVFAGTYLVGVKDANGCIGSNTVQVTEPPQLNSITNVNNVNCYGTSTGTINAAGTGGTPPYSYTWTAPGSTLATVPNVPIGNYGVTITDANGCVTTNSVSVTEPTQLSGISSSTNTICYNTASGAVYIAGTGGSAPYTYFWSTITSSLSTVMNVPPGNYPIIITDANNCTITKTVTVNQPTIAPISITVTSTNITCFGSCNGSILVTASGGTTPYTYHTMSSGPQANPTFTGLCPGNYTVYAEDANNCGYAMMAYISQPTNLTASISSTNATCGQNDGSLCATFSGGTSPFNTIWSNGVTTLCNNLVPAGAYSFTVTDDNGCSVVKNKTITSIGGPNVSIANQTNVSCFGGSNGGAITSVTGGTAPYTYSWTPSSINSPTLSNVPTGIYNVIVADSTGCVGTQSVVITQPAQLLIYANSNPECSGACNGSINANINGGTAPYQYNWSTGATTANYLPGLCVGIYSVQVTDVMGCVATQTAVVNQSPPITIVMNYTNVTCNASCNGAVAPVITGGTGPAVTFLWLPTLQTGNYVNNLCAGVYTLQITDAIGCVATETVAISNTGVSTMTNATLSTVSTKETCYNSGDGSIDLTVTGTNPGPFTYQWNNGANSQDSYNLNSNIYSVTVFDATMNCLTIQDTITADGTNCGMLSGNVFIDNNVDCIKNSGDVNCNSALIVVNPGNRYGYVNTVGDYTINNLPFGSYSTSIVYGGGNLIPTPSCSTTINTTLNVGAPISNNNNFSVNYNSITQPDMQVWGYSSSIVPGFIAHVTYQLTNINNVNGTGLFKAVLPSQFTSNITVVSPNTYTLSGDTVIWNFNNIIFSGGGTYFGIDFYVPVGTTLGSLFSTCMYAQPTVNDLNYGNNTYCYSRIVAGSYDPNEKTVSPVGLGASGDIPFVTTDLTYMIRFQNTGNGPAVNIVVKDTISPNVDISTFEMLSASHNYNIDILSGNVLRWKFNNIMLADSNHNEPASHGYIQYRIKRNPVYQPGTQIKNTAYIYFDFNAPVITNTTINTIEYITGIQSQNVSDDQWLVYPNPSSGILNLINNTIATDTKLKIEVVNSFGQLVYKESVTANRKTLDMSHFSNGIYFVKIVSDKQSCVKRVALSR